MLIEYSIYDTNSDDIACFTTTSIFYNLDDLKDKIRDDYLSAVKNFDSIDIEFDNIIRIYFDAPHTVRVMYKTSEDIFIQLSKNENCNIPDLLHNLDEYYHLQ